MFSCGTQPFFFPYIFCIAVTLAETYKSVFVPAMYVATLVQCLFFLVELFVGTVHSGFFFTGSLFTAFARAHSCFLLQHRLSFAS